MRSYEGEDDGDEEDFKLKEQLRRAARSSPRARVRVRVRVRAVRSAAARRRRPPASCAVFSQNAELQKQIEIMQDRWVCPWVPVHLCLTFSRHKLENTRLEGRVQVCDVQPLVGRPGDGFVATLKRDYFGIAERFC